MRTKYLTLPVYVIISLLFIISCKKSVDNSPAITKDVILPQNGAAVINAHNQFAFDFLRTTLERDQTGSNKLISPLSIYMALSMVYNGADHITRDKIQLALRLNNLSIDDLNKTCQALIEQMPGADSKVDLNIANSIWYRQNISPVPGFLTLTDTYYHASIKPLDFGSPDAVATINKWASDNTHKKIEKILQSISQDDLMFLINAIYFKGAWKYPFDKHENAVSPFNLGNGNTVSTTFMYQHNVSVNYFKNDVMEMVQLPYGGGNFNMYVLLPVVNVSASDVMAALDASYFQDWQSQMHKFSIDLYFPKFKFSYAIDDMKPHLSSMGMGVAFSGAADFSKMYNLQVNISKAIHKTFIEVNEEGTEAAAVTSISIGLTSAAPPSVFRADHPFLFVIAEKSSGAILFTGLMNNPTL